MKNCFPSVRIQVQGILRTGGQYLLAPLIGRKGGLLSDRARAFLLGWEVGPVTEHLVPRV
jgi:hypothetical protein